MRVPTDWLQDYLSSKLSPRQMAEALEQAGAEVEQIIESPKLDAKIVVGLVKAARLHPDADRLKLVKVAVGRKVYNIVCGAGNVRPGLKVALAQLGAKLPDGTVIKKAEIRGQSSEGMICSVRELGLGADHTGIMELDEHFVVGQPLATQLPKGAVLDVASAANRSDLQGIIGLAREVAAFSGAKLKLPEAKLPKIAAGDKRVQLASDKVSRYLLAELEVSAKKASPTWLAERLAAAGLRPINLVVDVTNFVMLETGQPLHAFDAAAVKLPVKVRAAKAGEKLVTLDGQERKLDASDLIIADSRKPIALAGVMGGQSSAVTAKTKRILLESASFDRATVRKSAQRHLLRTDASARFERGLPVSATPEAMARAITLLQQLAGGKPRGPVADELKVWPWIQHVGLKAADVSRRLGVKVSAKDMAAKLQSLGFSAEVFDIVAETKKHLGRPYKWGANYRQDGTSAFDCSYLTDYIYSLVGVMIGHTAHQQYQNGWTVELGDLRPGDLLFRGGHWQKVSKRERGGVSHNAIYVGNGQIIDAASYVRIDGVWQELPQSKQGVMLSPLEVITEDPEFLGARRYVEDFSDLVAVTVPWWRPDVRLPEDLIEEVGRLVGYDQVPATLPVWRPAKPEFDHFWPRLWQTKAALYGLGLFEVNTYAFVSAKLLEDFGLKLDRHLKVKNPLSLDQAYLRSSLLPSLATTSVKNQTYAKEFGMYEISKVFTPNKVGELPQENLHLGTIVKTAQNSYAGVKKVLDAICNEHNLSPTVRPADVVGLTPGRAAELFMGERRLGMIGEVHPDSIRELKFGSLGYLEIDLNMVYELSQPRRYQTVSRFPSISRDLALVLSAGVSWAQVQAIIAGTDLAECQFLSDYYGPDLPAGRKSLAVRLTFSSPDRTMTDKEADETAAKVLAVLKTKLGAELRR